MAKPEQIVVEPIDEKVKEEDVVVVLATPVRTTIREKITPFLPPPVVSAMGDVDPLLEPYVGPEASVTLVGSLLLGVFVWQLMKVFSSFAGGKAIVDDDDDDAVILKKESLRKDDYGDTVLLCGPSGGGKTRLFYALCYNQLKAETVTSLRANSGLVRHSGDSTAKPVRLMDYPGHASWQSPQLLEVLRSVPRLVLVLDSTQPVAAAADVFYQILSHAASTNRKAAPPTLFIACHKVDAPNAKNWRRIKIQLRTELERLLKVRAAETSGGSDALWWPPGKPLDLDRLEHAQVHFGSVSCEGGESPQGVEELREFVLTGKAPQTAGKKAQIRRV